MKAIHAAAMASALLATQLSHAQQTGGLPSLDARVVTLESQVSGLNSAIAAEAAARMAADEALQKQINSLQASFSASLAALQSSLASNVSSLQTQINSLSSTVQQVQTTVNSLNANATTAFFEHSAGSTNLNIPSPDDPDSFPFYPVVQTFVPAGKYVIYAHADVLRSSSDGAGSCFIDTGPFSGSDLTSANETLIIDSSTNSRARFVLMSRATVSEPGTFIVVRCASPRSVSPSSSITAIRVTTLEKSQ